MTPWNTFAREKLTKIFREKKTIIDIGGGLRAVRNRGNRYDPKHAWMAELIAGVDYKILDPVPDYHPDIVGDIHRLPFADDSCDAFICISVLEHVEHPFAAVKELYRALKPGGYCFVYVPFLYYYHAEVGYYKDFWRFSRDAVELLFKDFATVEIVSVRGALATWVHISPLGRFKFIEAFLNVLDQLLGKTRSRQTSGHYIFLTK